MQIGGWVVSDVPMVPQVYEDVAAVLKRKAHVHQHPVPNPVNDPASKDVADATFAVIPAALTSDSLSNDAPN